jgi:hypothetical protein
VRHCSTDCSTLSHLACRSGGTFVPAGATRDSTRQVHLRVMPTRGAVRSVLGDSYSHRQGRTGQDSNTPLRPVRCTTDPADAEEATTSLYRNPR